VRLAIFSKIGNDVPVPELCALLAEQGYHGVEWRTHPEGHVRPDHVLEDAKAAGAAARRHGLESLCLAGYCKTYEADQVEPQLAAAAEIGCPHVRVWPPAYRGNLPYQELFDGARRDLERIAGMARRHGVRAVLEIHYGNIAPSAGLMYRFVEGLDPRDIGLIYDPDNLTKEGHENWQMVLELIDPYLAYVQFRNSSSVPGPDPSSPAASRRWIRANADLEEGLIDWPAFLRVLRRLNYDGYLSNEDSRPVPLPARLAEDRDIIARLWREAGNGAAAAAPALARAG
jgi:sugar phosphate isomerase/epimerase